MVEDNREEKIGARTRRGPKLGAKTPLALNGVRECNRWRGGELVKGTSNRGAGERAVSLEMSATGGEDVGCWLGCGAFL